MEKEPTPILNRLENFGRVKPSLCFCRGFHRRGLPGEIPRSSLVPSFIKTIVRMVPGHIEAVFGEVQ